MKILFLLAWGALLIEGVLLAMLFASSGGGDAAGRGLGRGWALILLPFALVSAGLLYYAQTSPSKPLQWFALLVVSVPTLIAAGLWLSNNRKEAGYREEAAKKGKFADPAVTEIARALDRKDYAAVESLLAKNPKIDWSARDAWEATPLGYAILAVLGDYSGDPSVAGVKLLLAHGAPLENNLTRLDSNLLDTVYQGNTAGSIPLLQLLLDSGLDANSKNRDGLTAIHVTNIWQGLDKVKVLVAHGADLKALNNRKDRPQWSALMNSAYMQDWPLANYYLEQGADPKYQAPDGNTVATILEERARKYKDYQETPAEGYFQLLKALKN